MRERMHQLVDEYERLGEGKSIAEQELLVIEFGKQCSASPKRYQFPELTG